MASYAEEPRPHSQSSSDAHSHSGSITASEDAYVSDVNSSDTYVSDSEQEEGVVKVKEYQQSNSTLSEDPEKNASKETIRIDQLTSEEYPLSDLDNNLVGWDSQDDPANPRNFSTARKWVLLGLVSAMTFLSPVCSSIFSPATPFINAEFGNTSQLLASLTISVYVLGFSVGILFLSPLSEIYGRYWVLNTGSVFFCGFTLACALAPSLGSLIGLRFLAGVAGSSCLTIGTGVIADVFVTAQRGLAVSILSLGILFGPICGPIFGGFIAQRIGWRWNMWVVFIGGCILTASLFAFSQETYHPVLLDRKTRRLRSELNRPELQNIMTYKKDTAELTVSQNLRTGITRPLMMLATSPIVFFCSLYLSFLFGLLFLLFTSLTPVFIKTYGWTPELTGLAYLGIGAGNAIGVTIVARTSDATVVRLTKKNNGVYQPEMRLPLCLYFGLLIPLAFFLHGWSAQYHVHWIVPIIALTPFGLGFMGIFGALQTYIIDCFPQYAASAIGGVTALRCLFGAVLPLAGPRMTEALGLGWRNTVLGFLAVAFIPIPVLLSRYGKTIRHKYPVKF